MKITERQFIVLIDTLRGSVNIAEGIGLFGYNQECRKKIYDEIVNQQNGIMEVVESSSNGTEQEATD